MLKHCKILGLNIHKQSPKNIPSSVDEKERTISYDVTCLLQHLITDELDNLISTIILSTNGSICKEVETSQKHPKYLFLCDKEDRRKCSFVRSRNLIRNEQSLQNITHYTKNGEIEERHNNGGFIQGDNIN